MTYTYLKQLPIPSPESINPHLADYIASKVGLMYNNSTSLNSIAVKLCKGNNLGTYNEKERSELSAELEVIAAKVYGISKSELIYILDPSESKGLSYPTQTFPGLKDKEIKNMVSIARSAWCWLLGIGWRRRGYLRNWGYLKTKLCMKKEFVALLIFLDGKVKLKELN